MSARTIVEVVLLAVMLLSALLTVAGALRARDSLAMLHCGSFAGIAVTVPLTIAIAVAKLESEATVKAVILFAIVLLTSPISTHALGRAIYYRSRR